MLPPLKKAMSELAVADTLERCISSCTPERMPTGLEIYCLPLGGLKPPASAGSFEHATVFFDT